MLFNARTALQALLALGATTAVVGNSYYNDESVATRGYEDDYSLSTRGYYDEFNARSIAHSFHARGSANGGDFFLSARDLGKLGVRADDVSHVLVLRMNAPLTAQERANLNRQLTFWQGQVTTIEPLITAKRNEMSAAKRAKNQALAKRLSKDYSDLVQKKTGYNDEIHDIQKLLV